MPIFYATGSKRKAFFWATLSGISEPIGALFGWAILAGDVNNTAYGAMFGLVAGMMIYISLAELLPAAYRYDSNPVLFPSSLTSSLCIPLILLNFFPDNILTPRVINRL
jgi:ZIP family zinc transporter